MKHRNQQESKSPTKLKEEPVLKNRPSSSRLRQQDISACRPILTAKCVLLVVFLTGFTFIPLGYLSLVASDAVKEWKVDYSNCSRIDSTCELNINLRDDFNGDVYFYYGLTNYHQNSRRYMKSWNSEQITGDLGCTKSCSVPYKNVFINVTEAECNKGSIQGPNDSCKSGIKWEKPSSLEAFRCVRAIAPCGAIANSMFSDVFTVHDSTGQELPWTFKELLRETDIARFKNPELLPGEQNLCDAFNRRSIKPPNWKKSPCELDTKDPTNNGFMNFDFIVWMNTAAFSSFRKPYRKLRREGIYVNGMPKGLYKLHIENNYNIAMFNGKKFFIITTTSWLGGKNRFFGVTFLIVGSVCILCGIILSIIHKKSGHTLDEISQIPRYANDKHD